MASDLRTSEALPELRALASSHLGELDVEVVPSIRDWCDRRGLAETNLFRCGAVFRSRETGRYLVLLAELITTDMQSSVKTAMQIRGNLSDRQLAFLAEPENFARHLLLHEVAHALDDRRSEEECDSWAFSQLGLGHVV
jgi:hypothetical protein